MDSSLIVVDGVSLNNTLKHKSTGNSRLRIDYGKLLSYLDSLATYQNSPAHYYAALKQTTCALADLAAQETPINQKAGRVTSFGKEWGFIRDSLGTDYFAHFEEIEGEGFKALTPGEQVTFTASHSKKGRRATRIRRKGLSQSQHAMRKLSFLASLRKKGYEVIVCDSASHTDNPKKVLLRAYSDLLMGAFAGVYTELVLYTDDDDFHPLLLSLKELGVRVIQVSFDKRHSVADEFFTLDHNLEAIISTHHVPTAPALDR